MEKHFYSNGKLLLTGEYVVLDGALCLAVPTVYGQSLTLSQGTEGKLSWISKDVNGNHWFSHTFDIETDILNTGPDTARNEDVIQRLAGLLWAANTINPDFLTDKKGVTVITELGFPRNWGLGTSSTLISNIAAWAHIDPFELLRRTFSGSGYDIACARHHTPILYDIKQEKPTITPVTFAPAFRKNLYFVHLNQKQNSRSGIERYRSREKDKQKTIVTISGLTQEILRSSTLEDFESLITHHEEIIASLIELPTVRERLFPDYPGAIKSLGAWGGDFVMVTAKTDPGAYFHAKGYHTIIPYSEMVRPVY
ncbi:GYDIA family GHMP kinase [Sinomicrobium oceani]|uniref:GYDIA family GHMP kinase n=1 Tax=Sinomicrobium oceani TaxID=1150368 RepID=UPI00227B8F5F|nr:GYDIA family GHMP kinase [Sinomicrobium oceani]